MLQLQRLAYDIRQEIIAKVYQNGGHLASNLGVVELTIALHYVFDVYRDKVLFDVGHQCYTHKILTERSLDNLRSNFGVTGFPNPKESDADIFSVGHGTTSLSLALGLARARDLLGQNHDIIAIIGDGAFGGGMAYEALNDIGECQKRLIIILNDNEMSISKNVGAMSKHWAKMRTSKNYAIFKNNIKLGFEVLPILGKPIIKLAKKVQKLLRQEFGNKMIDSFGIPYYGPYDGHDLSSLINIFRSLKDERGPVFVHIVTEKGKGLLQAQNQPELYHGLKASSNTPNTQNNAIQDYETNTPKSKQAPTIMATPDKEQSFSDTMGNALVDLATIDTRIVAITAAMSGGTGLAKFANQIGERFFDVGMAEQHAATMAAGLAKGGCKPFFAVYSTFLQRSYDQVLHDVCINNLPVTFLIDRAGVVGSDGVTHQGVYDIAFLNQIPNMSIMSPKDGQELVRMIQFAANYNAPLAIRYPKSFETCYDTGHPINFEWEWLKKQNNKTVVMATGNRTLDIAMGCDSVDVVHATSIKPLDTKCLDHIMSNYKLAITMEDGVIIGGFGQQVAAYIDKHSSGVKTVVLGHCDDHIVDLDINSVFKKSGMTVEGVGIMINDNL